MKQSDARFTWKRAGQPVLDGRYSRAHAWHVDGGLLGADAAGRIAMVRIELRPAIAFAGERQPDAGELSAIHHLAHERCHVANSLTAEIVVLEPR